MQLPQRPHPRHLSNQAKALRKAHREGDREAAARLRAELPRFADDPLDEVLAAELSLQEAQHVLAKEYGFASWKELGAYVKAHEIPEDSVFVHDTDDWLEQVQNDEFFRAADMHESDEGIIRRELNLAGHHRNYQVVYKSITSAPLWNTPEERVGDHKSLRVTHSISAHHRDAAKEQPPEKERDLFEEAKRESLQAVHEDFSARVAATLSRITNRETRAGLFAAGGDTKYAEVARNARDGDALVYRLGIDPGGTALMFIAMSSMHSFIGKPYPGKGAELSADELERALAIARALVADLQRSWASRRRLQIGDPLLCENEYRVLGLDFEAVCTYAELIVQSDWASQGLDLYYPDQTLRSLLSHLVAAA